MIIKHYIDFVYKLFFCIVVILVGCGIYALGRIHGLELQKPPIVLEMGQEAHRERILEQIDSASHSVVVNAVEGLIQEDCKVLASVNGSKYYFPTCGGLTRIDPKNLRCFSSEEGAIEANYELSKTCL